ncbi:sensor histidine kinase [Litoribacter populi]|uniref:sensor histidine kinase n=1 Tax=Litoribacter populi TaxID=2598460 RepID=UPI00117EC475|nr:histidine kinase [Litoribacter populi]
MLILLFGLSYIAPLSLEFFAGQFPEYTHMAVLSQRYGIRSFSDVFSLLPFIWVLTSVLFGNIMTATFEAFIRNYETNKRNILLQKEKTEIELNFLKAQFHPHFLFNTLNNIYGLVMENEQAGEAVLKMSDLLRFSLYESEEDSIPLSREIQFLEDYIHLERIRHHEHVTIDFEVKVEDQESPIAPLLLITFVENAFKHGVNNSIRNSWVNICLMQKGNTIAFEVSNSKPAQSSKEEVPGGIGLENVKRRLTLLYPQKYELVVSDKKGVFSLALKLATT